MDIISELQYFYDLQADNFYQTRKKHWVEFEILLEKIKEFEGDEIKILELGCGAGRFYGFLKENLDKKITYKGIDLSSNLINIAKSQYPDGDFESREMNQFLEETSQQEYDFVVAIASFQHLPDVSSRLGTLKNIYRILGYGGKILMINRSFSKRFLQKYKKNIFKSILKAIITFGAKSWNDVYVPWKDNEMTFYRYYHIFTLGEIQRLAKNSSFVIKKLGFISKKGVFSQKWTDSRNTLTVLEKNVI